jgi:exopolyphosphatase/guanosine-5'-triphosphate,3'-diphosphate pyrophosphatase
LLEYQRFLHLTRSESVLVPTANIREGLIISGRSGPNTLMREEFTVQILASAKSLARKYHGDDKHSVHVGMLAVKLFEALKMELGLEARSRLLLEVAAILHDIGMYINGKNHEVHSAYIISNSEIFGLSREEKRVVERVAAYHRGHKILQQDREFTIMPRPDRVLIMKLSAILRVADALDRSHRQEIKDFSVDFRKDAVVITCRVAAKLEKMAVADKADMFENVFGYRVILE